MLCTDCSLSFGRRLEVSKIVALASRLGCDTRSPDHPITRDHPILSVAKKPMPVWPLYGLRQWRSQSAEC
jgi:hypothetical protein